MTPEEQSEVDLARLVSGELDPESDTGRAAMAGAGMSVTELEGLRELALQLDEAAVERDQIVAASKELEAAPGSDRIASTIESLAAESRGRSWGWLVPAAAILMILPLLFWRDAKPAGDGMLGKPVGEIEFVQDDESRFGAVSIELPDGLAGARLELRVFDLSSSNTEPTQTYNLEGTRWSNPGEQKTWATQVGIQVWAYPVGQEPVLIGSAESSSD